MELKDLLILISIALAIMIALGVVVFYDEIRTMIRKWRNQRNNDI